MSKSNPVHTRNFWVDAFIDGQKTQLSGGPRAKDGGLTVRVYQRGDGAIGHAFTIKCEVGEDGKLSTTVQLGHDAFVLGQAKLRAALVDGIKLRTESQR